MVVQWAVAPVEVALVEVATAAAATAWAAAVVVVMVEADKAEVVKVAVDTMAVAVREVRRRSNQRGKPAHHHLHQTEAVRRSLHGSWVRPSERWPATANESTLCDGAPSACPRAGRATRGW